MAKPDKATLVDYIDELNLSEALKANLLQELEADEARATAFVNGRLRQADYTKKTQELADQRKTLDVAVTEQVKEYATELQKAQDKIAEILKDLETEQISRATAENRLKLVAKKYEIPKEDLADLIKEVGTGEPPKTNTQGTGLTAEAMEGLLKKHKEQIYKELMPEILTLTMTGAIQQDIRREHQELTGKWLTNEEMKKLVTEASNDASKGGLIKLWESTYGIQKIRDERHDKEVGDAAVAAHVAEETRKNSDAALRQVHNQGSSQTQLSTSPVLRQYRNRDGAEDGQPGGDNKADKGEKGGGQHKQEPQPRLTGAERAAAKWIDRSRQGKIGKPLEAA